MMTSRNGKSKPRKGSCLWCGRTIRVVGGRGPIPSYCKQSHRQRAYELRVLDRLLKAAKS